MAATMTPIATDSAAELNEIIGDDATATFENDPKFIDSDPTGMASSENIAVQRDEDDTEDSEEEEEELEDADDDDDLEDEDDDDVDLGDEDEDEDDDEEEDDEDEVGVAA
jgi:ribonuclease E